MQFKTCFKKIILTTILTTISYTLYSQPTEEWVRRFSWGQDDYAAGISVKVDPFQNVYVLMNLYKDTTHNDFGLAKYSNSGNLIWSRYYHYAGDVPVAFSVSPSGDIYIVGNTTISITQHIITIKYNSQGELQWAKVFDITGPNNGANDIALDIAGNVIITGGKGAAGFTSNALTIKYSPGGDTLWSRTQVIGLHSSNLKVVTDASGNIYTTGRYDPVMNKTHLLSQKYDPDGNLVWHSTYFYDSTVQRDFGRCLALDLNRNLYIAGTSYTNQPGYISNSLIKINSNGVLQWARVYRGIGNNDSCSFPSNIAVTSNGNNIYYTTTCATGGSADFVTLGYNSNGDSTWVRRFPHGPGLISSNGYSDLKIDRLGNVYIACSFNNTVSGNDIVTIKYLSNGIQQWTAAYNGPLANSGDYPYSLEVDSSFNVFVTGRSSRYHGPPNPIVDAVTIKYSQPIGIISNYNELPDKFMLYQNYPNPFNPTTNVKYSVKSLSNIKIVVYDIQGREAMTLVNQKHSAGTYSVDFSGSGLASGVYFYSLITDETLIDTRKMILLK
jgi:hypothetical protein